MQGRFLIFLPLWPILLLLKRYVDFVQEGLLGVLNTCFSDVGNVRNGVLWHFTVLSGHHSRLRLLLLVYAGAVLRHAGDID